MAIYKYENTEMYYETVGEGTPFLIIHGWAIDHRFTRNMMEPVFASLADISGRKRVLQSENGVDIADCKGELRSKNGLDSVDCKIKRIYIDVPGMGLSKPGKIINGDGVIKLLDAFMEEMYPGEKFYIGGNSFGSEVSRAYTAKHPEKILALLLIVPSTGMLGKLPKSGVAVRDDEFLKTLTPSEKAAFTCMNAVLTKDKWEMYKEQVYPSVLINEDNEFLHKKFRGKFGFDITAAFRKRPFKGPVLILCGKYDTAVGYEDQKEWLNIFPNATYEVIDNAGHNIFVDQPEEFTRIVTDFLRSILQ